MPSLPPHCPQPFLSPSTFAVIPGPWRMLLRAPPPRLSFQRTLPPPPPPHARASLQFASFSSRETVVSLVPLALLASLAPL